MSGTETGGRSREWDAEIGLYYYRARHYDPAAGRFLQTDPIGATLLDANLYAYVGSNPVNRVDPEGRDAVSVGLAVVGFGAAVAGGVAAFTGAPVLGLTAAAYVAISWATSGAAAIYSYSQYSRGQLSGNELATSEALTVGSAVPVPGLNAAFGLGSVAWEVSDTLMTCPAGAAPSGGGW